MSCKKPILAYQTVGGQVQFHAPDTPHRTRKLPCGQCRGCRLKKSREWAARCIHEAQLHQDNCYITLSYNPEHLPPGGTLLYRDWQLFIRRVRKAARKPASRRASLSLKKK